MNIRTRKSNHRAVNIKGDIDETENDLDYFLPLLKERKATIRQSALNHLINIFIFQNRREQIHELDIQFANALCDIIVAGKDQQEVQLALHALELIAIHDGLDRVEFFKTVRGVLSPLIDESEDYVNAHTMAGCLDALAISCFVNAPLSETYQNTIDLFKEVILTHKNKQVLNRALRGWLLMLTRLEREQINKHIDLLDRITELSGSSYQDLSITCAIAIAFLVSEMDIDALEAQEAEEQDEEEDQNEIEDYDDYDEDEDRYSHKHHGKQSSQNIAREDGGEEEEEDDDEEASEDEEEENTIISLVENLVINNHERGKKKFKSNTLLRQIVKTLKEGTVPRETLKIDDQPFYFEGWRKYIQLHEIKKTLKSGASIQWGYNRDLRALFGIHMRSQLENTILLYEQKAILSPNSSRSKQRTQDLLRDRRNASNVISYHHHQDE